MSDAQVYLENFNILSHELSTFTKSLTPAAKQEVDQTLAAVSASGTKIIESGTALPEVPNFAETVVEVFQWQLLYEGVFALRQTSEIVSSIIAYQPLRINNSWSSIKDIVANVLSQTQPRFKILGDVGIYVQQISTAYWRILEQTQYLQDWNPVLNIIDNMATDKSNLEIMAQQLYDQAENSSSVVLNISNVLGTLNMEDLTKNHNEATQLDDLLHVKFAEYSKIYENGLGDLSDYYAQVKELGSLTFQNECNQETVTHLQNTLDIIQVQRTELEKSQGQAIASFQEYLSVAEADIAAQKREIQISGEKLQAKARQITATGEAEYKNEVGYAVEKLNSLPDTITKTKIVKEGTWPFQSKKKVYYQVTNPEKTSQRKVVQIMNTELADYTLRQKAQEELNNKYLEALSDSTKRQQEFLAKSASTMKVLSGDVYDQMLQENNTAKEFTKQKFDDAYAAASDSSQRLIQLTPIVENAANALAAKKAELNAKASSISSEIQQLQLKIAVNRENRNQILTKFGQVSDSAVAEESMKDLVNSLITLSTSTNSISQCLYLVWSRVKALTIRLQLSEALIRKGIEISPEAYWNPMETANWLVRLNPRYASIAEKWMEDIVDEEVLEKNILENDAGASLSGFYVPSPVDQKIISKNFRHRPESHIKELTNAVLMVHQGINMVINFLPPFDQFCHIIDVAYQAGKTTSQPPPPPS